jgi:phosphatidyl-myo-inositol dimannoside synthase
MVLVLSPALSPIGGVQLSGRLAWETISRASSRNGADARLVMYGKPELSSHRNVATAWSRPTAIFLAVRARRTARTILVWHLDLVKLLPFARRPGTRVFIYLHGVEAFRRIGCITRRALRPGDVFLTNTDFTWRRFVEANPLFSGAIHARVPLGLNGPAPAIEPRRTPAALMIGRLRRNEDYKGHREVIAAWNAVRERLPGAELWIAGEGDLRLPLEREAQGRGLAGSVRFLGTVSDAEKDELLRRCRCLAMPSTGEGFGLVYVEAMRAGRPCLVSTLDAGQEVVNPPEAGLAVDPRRSEDVAAALARLLTEGPEWQQWSDAARARYASRYTRAHFERRLMDVLQLA